MPSNQLVFIIFTVTLLSIGQILFKVAALSLANEPLVNFKVILAASVYGLATVMWFFVLKVTPLKTAYPFVGLAFILVPIFSSVFLDERFDLRTLVGSFIIALGVWISVLDK